MDGHLSERTVPLTPWSGADDISPRPTSDQ